MQPLHFVKEYESHVASLKANHTREQAMHLAVGGDYDCTGEAQARFLASLGLRDSMSLIDLGCGSGRTAKHLASNFPNLRYLGIDIVQDLLDYAAEQAPRHFRFLLNRSLYVPVPDSSANFVCAFSLFTHLLHEESFCYLSEAKRMLLPGGTIVFSYLDFRENWPVFADMVAFAREQRELPHLNMFIEPSAIHAWADNLGLHLDSLIVGAESPVGQSVAVLKKSA